MQLMQDARAAWDQPGHPSWSIFTPLLQQSPDNFASSTTVMGEGGQRSPPSAQQDEEVDLMTELLKEHSIDAPVAFLPPTARDGGGGGGSDLAFSSGRGLPQPFTVPRPATFHQGLDFLGGAAGRNVSPFLGRQAPMPPVAAVGHAQAVGAATLPPGLPKGPQPTATGEFLETCSFESVTLKECKLERNP